MQDQSLQNDDGLERVSSNPYTDNNIYPIAGLITCSFLDSYIGTTNVDFSNAMLPGNLKKGLPNIYFSDIQKEVTTLLDKLSMTLKQLAKWFNKDDCSELKSFYNDYRKEFIKKANEKIDKFSLLKIEEPPAPPQPEPKPEPKPEPPKPDPRRFWDGKQI